MSQSLSFAPPPLPSHSIHQGLQKMASPPFLPTSTQKDTAHRSLETHSCLGVHRVEGFLFRLEQRTWMDLRLVPEIQPRNHLEGKVTEAFCSLVPRLMFPGLCSQAYVPRLMFPGLCSQAHVPRLLPLAI